MTKLLLTADELDLVAQRFRALAEPTRLSVLNLLMQGESTVTDLVEGSGLGQANVSKHLKTLHELGFVTRRKEGLWVWYAIADPGVEELCTLMCSRLPTRGADIGSARSSTRKRKRLTTTPGQ